MAPIVTWDAKVTTVSWFRFRGPFFRHQGWAPEKHPRNLRNTKNCIKLPWFLKGVTFFHPVQAIILGYPTFESVYFPKFSWAVSCAQDSLTLRRFCWTSRSLWNDHIWHQISIQTYTIRIPKACGYRCAVGVYLPESIFFVTKKRVQKSDSHRNSNILTWSVTFWYFLAIAVPLGLWCVGWDLGLWGEQLCHWWAGQLKENITPLYTINIPAPPKKYRRYQLWN